MDNKVLLVIAAVVALTLAAEPLFIKETLIDAELTKQQKQDVVYQLGLEGYKTLLENGCSGDIANKMSTGEWNDHWCASHYNHLDLK